MKQFRKKPVVIEAMQWIWGINVGDDTRAGKRSVIEAWMGQNLYVDPSTSEAIIHTLEGDMTCSVGDWIIKGVQGEFYPCKPDIFWATYDEVAGVSE